jgi:hypothetical protein
MADSARRSLTDADVEAIAEKVAEKLRPRRRAEAVPRVDPKRLEQTRARLRRRGLLSPPGRS